MAEWSIQDISDAIKRDKHQGFEVLVRRFSKRILFMCHRILRDMPEAEDATQEAFLRVYAALDQRDRDGSTLVALLYRTAGNVCLKFLRRRLRAGGPPRDPFLLDGSPLFVAVSPVCTCPNRPREQPRIVSPLLPVLFLRMEYVIRCFSCTPNDQCCRRYLGYKRGLFLSAAQHMIRIA